MIDNLKTRLRKIVDSSFTATQELNKNIDSLKKELALNSWHRRYIKDKIKIYKMAMKDGVKHGKVLLELNAREVDGYSYHPDPDSYTEYLLKNLREEGLECNISRRSGVFKDWAFLVIRV